MKAKIIFYLVYVVFISPASLFSQEINDKGLSAINSSTLINLDRKLSSADFDGRLAGSNGYNKAAEFCAKQFKDYGIKPAGDSGYFQFFNIEYNRIDTPVVLSIVSEGNEKVFKLGKDFVLRGFTGSADIDLPVAFCGYGISRPDLGYDDYSGINVKGKVVIVFKQNPEWKIDDKEWGDGYPREKSKTAYDHGALGILFTSLPNEEKPQGLIGSVLHGEGEQLENFPQLHISEETANAFLRSSNITLKETQTKIDKQKKPRSFLTKTNAKIEVNARYFPDARAMNIVGEIPGSDPNLKEEYLIIGAHLDHVGSQAGLLFPGADDNASGSSGILTLAKAFQSSEEKPKRSIIFILFAGEEQGLNGSKFFVKNLKIDTSKIVAMFNLDCIGVGDSIQIGNGKSAPELWELIKNIDRENSNLVVKNTWKGGGADATPFYDKGIPCAYFVSKYSYTHLHLPDDTIETLNPDLFKEVVKLAYLSARKVSDGTYIREGSKN